MVDAAGLAFSVAQTILATLQCSELKELFGSDLESLERSVTTIQAVLLDAESKQANGIELSAQEHDFIEKIKDVVYDADDLLDGYVTREKLQQIRMESGNKLSTKVRGLCSRFKHLAIASPEVKKTAKKLDDIGRDAQNFKFDSVRIKISREETCSYVNENHIVGREDDQRRIVDMLLHPIVQGELPVLAIVGVGGLGKTALAQLVYKDPKIQNEFSLRLWVCVSDEGGNKFNVKAILADIYKVVNPEKNVGDLKLEVLVHELRSKLDQNKSFLVLDDLWNENSDECRSLLDILIGLAQRGSRILVTTRSIRTAKAIGSSRPYELHGLSDSDSWDLFEMKVGRKIKESHDLFEVCTDIVKKCVNVPLAIKVIGSLLCDVPENEWHSFQQCRVIDIKKDDNGIMQILKFSYFHLSPSLKSCFTYCALFPKDFKIEKENLISMWMAHGYVKDEVEAEYHFQILVQRCFFQDIKEYDHGKYVEFKIHDLIHDMAQEVAGKEIYLANDATAQLDKKIRHLNDGAPETRTKGFVTPSKIRTYVYHSYDDYGRSPDIQFPVSTLLAKCRHLRVLDLHKLGIRQLPDAIGKLLHLRHLDLNGNKQLKTLPEVITKLVHLAFLNLDECDKLKELPRDFKKLVNLRTLYVPYSVEYIPLGMASMTSLTRLNRFVVSYRKSCLEEEDLLDSLRGLRNLKGSLNIRVKGDYKHTKEYCGEGGYICNTQHLNIICIIWDSEPIEGRVGNDEDLLEDLQPHRNLKQLQIHDYQGVRIPRWAREDSITTFLPNLVNVFLFQCHGLEELPWLGRLQHLKILGLAGLRNVEYMENRRSIGGSSDDGDVASNSLTVVESSTILFFSSLEKLYLHGMPKLKGWWRGSSDCTSEAGEDEIVNNDNNICMLTSPAHPLPSFPRLSELSIVGCPNLTSIPLCPAVQTLKLSDVNKKIGVLMIEEDKKRVGSSTGNEVENCGNQYLKALPMVAFQCLVNMKIKEDNKVESLSKFEEVLRNCSSSLKSLELVNCLKLRSVCQGGLEYLTALEELTLHSLPELEFGEREENEEEMPWRSLGHSLRSLKLFSLEKVDNLPKVMRYFTSLEYLEIINVPLKEIPEWIECLSSLQSLIIYNCKCLESLPRALLKLTSLEKFQLSGCSDELKRKCEKPDGEYCPILEHITHFNSL